MVKKWLSKSLFAVLILIFSTGASFADENENSSESNNPVQAATMQARCQNPPEGFPECADSPAECASVPGKFIGYITYKTPINCLFLNEPIGGQTGYDLYKITPEPSGQVIYDLWYGEALTANEVGPVQAVLTYEEGKELQGPFGLLYNYLALIYNYLSGIIIAVVILIIIVGGIIMTTSNGNQEGFNTGKSMITKALIGMVIWFLASVILYTINPTFFSF